MLLSIVSSNEASNKFSTVIFDLGNVVLAFDHWIICRKLASRFGIKSQRVFEIIFKTGIEKQFNEGVVSPSEFTQKCSKELGVNLSLVEFKSVWSDIFSENLPVIELIKDLKSRVKIFLLSNTNIWHMEHIRRKFNVLELFDGLILSFNVGSSKPHRKIFERALEVSGESANPSQCIFIDDIESHVQMAMQMGFYGIHYKSADELTQEFKNIGVL